jgi:hypothetical protein
MDRSTNPSHHINGQTFGLLNGIEDFTGAETIQDGEDLSQYFDPELFDQEATNNGMSLPSLSLGQEFNATASRQSATPELHQYGNTQQTFQPQQYQSPYFDSRQLNQNSFDPRFYSRSSASPLSYDNGYPYQSQLNFQQYGQQQLGMQQRQSPTQLHAIPQRQPQPYVNITSRPSQLSQMQVRQPMIVSMTAKILTSI